MDWNRFMSICLSSGNPIKLSQTTAYIDYVIQGDFKPPTEFLIVGICYVLWQVTDILTI